MGQLNHARGGRIRTGGTGERGDGGCPGPRMPRRIGPGTGPVPASPRRPSATGARHRRRRHRRPRARSSTRSVRPPAVQDCRSERLSTSVGPRDPSATSSSVASRRSRARPGPPSTGHLPSHIEHPHVLTWRTDAAASVRRRRPDGRPGSGTWPTAAGSKPSIRAGGPGDDEGGPGRLAGQRGLAPVRPRDGLLPDVGPRDGAAHRQPAAGRATAFGPGAGRPRRNDGPPGTIDGRTIDPESGVLLPPERRTDRLGRPLHWDTGRPGAATRNAELARNGAARTEPARNASDAGTHGRTPTARDRRRATRAWPGSSRSPRRSRAAGASSACRTGSAGSSCAPGWTASRATSASTAAGCSSPPPRSSTSPRSSGRR